MNLALSADFFALAYLACAVLFILGIKGLAHPSTARQGNALSMFSMAAAIGITLLSPAIDTYSFIVLGLFIGAVIGVPIAMMIKLTALPQLVALYNSFVGLAATLLAVAVYLYEARYGELTMGGNVEMFMGAWIGAITFTGSVVAFSKLQGILSGKPMTYTGQHWVNLALGLGMFGFGLHFIFTGSLVSLLIASGLGFVLGVTLVLPIGGADMPVIISVLNSYSGWAAAATGFTLGNMLLILTGALVGSSGAILSYIMCKAMNRSFLSVVLGGFGADDAAAAETQAAADKGIKQAAVEDMAFMMENAERVILVPGYGMAVAQAQHALKEVSELLEEKGVSVKFAIHPVAGRMPGHMNVLLAEADVPYDRVFERDDINSEFAQTDVVLIIGANDVVNPDAQKTPGSPLFGMPILEAYKAKMVFVVKRSMRTGYAGVENALFTMDNCNLVFGDAKAVCEKLAGALKG